MLATSLLGALLSACAWFRGAPLPAHVVNHHLADRAGFSLYVYDRDVQWAGESRCLEECAQRFPPMVASAADRRTKDYGIVARPDGTRQWTLRGKPLYRFSGDAQPGDTRGEAYANLWRLARP